MKVPRDVSLTSGIIRLWLEACEVVKGVCMVFLLLGLHV